MPIPTQLRQCFQATHKVCPKPPRHATSVPRTHPNSKLSRIWMTTRNSSDW